MRGNTMPLHPSWPDIALRLVLTAAAGALLGTNREEHGRSAGLRTTMLVSLAAALSMIQANLLLDLAGKSTSSFVVMDLMRLPLGILSGMGFIGAGAILRRDTLVTGVTTAATLWFATTMGLCFGGGQLGLGLVALALAFLILWALKPLEKHWNREVQGTLTLSGPALPQEEIERRIAEGGGKISAWLEAGAGPEGAWRGCRVKWRMPDGEKTPPPFVASLVQAAGITRVEWKVTGRGS